MVIAFGVGILLGLMFFGGLWLSVEKLSQVKYPAALMILSMFSRMALLLAGFYLVLQAGSLQRGLAAMAGVFAARLMIVFTVKSKSGLPE